MGTFAQIKERTQAISGTGNTPDQRSSPRCQPPFPSWSPFPILCIIIYEEATCDSMVSSLNKSSGESVVVSRSPPFHAGGQLTMYTEGFLVFQNDVSLVFSEVAANK